MEEAPKVFISYSHDSPDHKQWVAKLGTKLREEKIDAILDQWGIGPGDDITRFMEKGLSSSVRVIVVCTDEYVRKANEGVGGVSYEKIIVTAELVKNLGTNKFIPIIRQSSGIDLTPKFLETRYHIDFREDTLFDDKIAELIQAIKDIPSSRKPPLGMFRNEENGNNIEIEKKPLPEIILSSIDPTHVYNNAVALIRNDDIFGWRQLIKNTKQTSFESLSTWRQKNEGSNINYNDIDTRIKVLEEGIQGISPLIIIALCGVESGVDKFKSQESLLSDILNISGWSRSGGRLFTEFPETLGFIYQALYGATCLLTNQLDHAIKFANIKVQFRHGSYLPLYMIPGLMGWPDSFGPNCNKSCEYISNAAKRWKWLINIFENEIGYRSSLVAYYMALTIHEFAHFLREYKSKDAIGKYPHLFIPQYYVNENDEIQNKAFSMLFINYDKVQYLWESVNVKKEDMNKNWNIWVLQCKEWLSDVHLFSVDSPIFKENLFDMI